MKEFIKKNSYLIIIVSFVLIFGGVFISSQKLFFARSFAPKPIFRPATGESFFLEKEAIREKISLKNIHSSTIIIISIIFLSLIGGGFLTKHFVFKIKRAGREKQNEQKKEDLKNIQEALEAFHRIHQYYPDNQSEEFKKIIASLADTLHYPFTDNYYYENPNSGLQRYRLWCQLEGDDPKKDKEVYEISSSKH